MRLGRRPNCHCPSRDPVSGDGRICYELEGLVLGDLDRDIRPPWASLPNRRRHASPAGKRLCRYELASYRQIKDAKWPARREDLVLFALRRKLQVADVEPIAVSAFSSILDFGSHVAFNDEHLSVAEIAGVLQTFP